MKEVKTTTQREENGFRSYIHHIQERVAPGDSMPAGLQLLYRSGF